jgi:hypothetical protein
MALLFFVSCAFGVFAVCNSTQDGGILGAVIFLAFWLIVPNDERMDPHGKIDYIGAALGVSGFVN